MGQKTYGKEMRKVLFAAILAFITLPAQALEYFDGMYDGYQLIYSPGGNYFAPGGMFEDRIVLTKKNSAGSGVYSVYYKNDKLAFALGSNFEIIINGRLIACHNANLTFYNVVYKKGKFAEKKMTAKEVQALFPSVKVVKLSEFVKHRLILYKKPFETIEVLLFNDTKQDFYKYSFEPKYVKKTDIAGLIEIPESGRITFSHYGEDNQAYPRYIIDVRLKWF